MTLKPWFLNSSPPNTVRWSFYASNKRTPSCEMLTKVVYCPYKNLILKIILALSLFIIFNIKISVKLGFFNWKLNTYSLFVLPTVSTMTTCIVQSKVWRLIYSLCLILFLLSPTSDSVYKWRDYTSRLSPLFRQDHEEEEEKGNL